MTITWRNVSDPNGSNAAIAGKLYDNAGDNFSSGINAIGSAIKGFDASQTNRIDTGLDQDLDSQVTALRQNQMNGLAEINKQIAEVTSLDGVEYNGKTNTFAVNPDLSAKDKLLANTAITSFWDKEKPDILTEDALIQQTRDLYSNTESQKKGKKKTTQELDNIAMSTASALFEKDKAIDQQKLQAQLDTISAKKDYAIEQEDFILAKEKESYQDAWGAREKNWEKWDGMPRRDVFTSVLGEDFSQSDAAGVENAVKAAYSDYYRDLPENVKDKVPAVMDNSYYAEVLLNLSRGESDNAIVAFFNPSTKELALNNTFDATSDRDENNVTTRGRTNKLSKSKSSRKSLTKELTTSLKSSSMAEFGKILEGRQNNRNAKARVKAVEKANIDSKNKAKIEAIRLQQAANNMAKSTNTRNTAYYFGNNNGI